MWARRLGLREVSWTAVVEESAAAGLWGESMSF